MAYTIKELRDNIELEEDNPSFCTFDVLTELEGESKWLSIPYDLYFDWASQNNDSLAKYINKPEFKNHHDIISDLIELGFSFEESMLNYIENFYTRSVFKKLPTYDPDKFFGFMEEDDDDEIF